MLTLPRHLLIALSIALASCATNEPTKSIEEPIEEGDDDEPVKDSGRPTGRVDAGRQDASTPPPPPRDAGAPRDAYTPPQDANVTRDATVADAGKPPDPFAPGDRTPSPDNIPECPKVAPENPIGDCLGVPVYAVCSYTTYTCICDWYHWLCL